MQNAHVRELIQETRDTAEEWRLYYGRVNYPENLALAMQLANHLEAVLPSLECETVEHLLEQVEQLRSLKETLEGATQTEEVTESLMEVDLKLRRTQERIVELVTGGGDEEDWDVA